MLRSAKPQLKVTTILPQTSRPSVSLKSPMAPRTPISPASPASKCFSSLQVPSYAYVNSSSAKSILKKNPVQARSTDRHIEFIQTPTVYCVTPIENTEEYYGKHTKISREERRWIVRE